MSLHLHRLTLVCLACWLLCFHTVAQQSRVALLVGVGAYPKGSGWEQLSAANDVDLIRRTLQTQGFSPKNLLSLKDQQATKAAILDKLKNDFLNKVQAGGLAVFHFSGHGQQVCDDNGDESDGLDEALVPYDSPLHYKQGSNTGQSLLRDDELGQALAAVRRKLGPNGNLLVLIDACHSGTATRGRRKARGTDIIMGPITCAEPETSHSNILESEAEEQGIAPMTALFSSSSMQLSYEYQNEDGKNFGLFSFAFSKAMSELPEQTTYQRLLDRVKQEVKAFTNRQTPMAEGNTQQLVFGKGIRPAKKQYSILSYLGNNSFLINAGSLLGLLPKSKVAFYPKGTQDTTGVQPLAMGTVQKSKAFESNIQLLNPIENQILEEASVFVMERNYGELSVRLQLELEDLIFQKELATALKEYGFIQIVEKNGDLFLEQLGDAKQSFLLSQSDDYVLWEQKNIPLEAEALKNRLFQPINNYFRANYLRQLELRNADMQAEVVLLQEKQGKWVPLKESELVIGTLLRLRVKNVGKSPFYFKLVDIQPDHAISEIPFGEGLRLEVGKGITAPFVLEASEPLGTEVIKIFATKEPLEINFNHRGNNSSIKRNSLESLLSQLLLPKMETRGQSPSLPSEIGFIGSLVLEIVK